MGLQETTGIDAETPTDIHYRTIDNVSRQRYCVSYCGSYIYRYLRRRLVEFEILYWLSRALL
jgi:hypothetical protein